MCVCVGGAVRFRSRWDELIVAQISRKIFAGFDFTVFCGENLEIGRRRTGSANTALPPAFLLSRRRSLHVCRRVHL